MAHDDSIGHDIAELRKLESLYRALVETTGTGYVILDIHGKVVDANPEYLRLSGRRDLQDAKGRSVIEWTADYEKEKNIAAVQQCVKEGSIRNLEIDYVDAHGNVIPVEINATMVTIDGTTMILTLCRDITRRRQTEKKQREGEERLKRLTAELTEQKKVLQQKNIALKEILARFELERMATRKSVARNAETSILPTLWKLRRRVNENDRKYVEMVEASVKDITSRFGSHIAEQTSLSAREMEVCNMIRNGLSTKEMAEILGVAMRTVDTFRNRVRKKLGISNKDINLFSHLRSMGAAEPNVECHQKKRPAARNRAIRKP